MRMPQPSWRGSKVILATFSIVVYPLHGIELTEQGVPLGDSVELLYLARFEWSRHMHKQL